MQKVKGDEIAKIASIQKKHLEAHIDSKEFIT